MKPSKKMNEAELNAFKAAMEYIYGVSGSKPVHPSEYLDNSKRARLFRLDDDGQPINRSLRQKDVGIRQVDELVGILKGILSDKLLVDTEVKFLSEWLESNTFASKDWPGSVLHERIVRALDDDNIDSEELEEIKSIIESIVKGGKSSESAIDLTTDLPIDKPTPRILFKDKVFCFTGKLLWGKRQDAEQAIINKGGKISKINKSLNYLVLGEISSRDWKHSTHGLKILKAVQHKENGVNISIISEKDWAEALRINLV